MPFRCIPPRPSRNTKSRQSRSFTAGVEMDVLGIAYEQFSRDQREAVVALHPRGGHFKRDMTDASYQGMKHRPEGTFGTVNDDVLAFKNTRFERADFYRVILRRAWPS
jgi:hypothetical protein